MTEASHNTKTNVNTWFSSVLPSPYGMQSVLPYGGVPLPVSLSFDAFNTDGGQYPMLEDGDLLDDAALDDADFEASLGCLLEEPLKEELDPPTVTAQQQKKTKRKRVKSEVEIQKEREQKCAITRRSRIRQKDEIDSLENTLKGMQAEMDEKSALVEEMAAELEHLKKDKDSALQERRALQEVFTSLTSKRETRSRLVSSRARFLARNRSSKSGSDSCTEIETDFCSGSDQDEAPNEMRSSRPPSRAAYDTASSSDDNEDIIHQEPLLKRSDLDEMRKQINHACKFVSRVFQNPTGPETAKMCTRDAIFNCSSTKGCAMIEQYFRFMQRLQIFIPDLRLEKLEVTFSEELVMLCGSMKGTHTQSGGLRSMEPSNPILDFETRVVFMFGFNRRGLIANLTKTMNITELYSQLGWSNQAMQYCDQDKTISLQESLFSLVPQ